MFEALAPGTFCRVLILIVREDIYRQQTRQEAITSHGQQRLELPHILFLDMLRQLIQHLHAPLVGGGSIGRVLSHRQRHGALYRILFLDTAAKHAREWVLITAETLLPVNRVFSLKDVLSPPAQVGEVLGALFAQNPVQLDVDEANGSSYPLEGPIVVGVW